MKRLLDPAIQIWRARARTPGPKRAYAGPKQPEAGEGPSPHPRPVNLLPGAHRPNRSACRTNLDLVEVLKGFVLALSSEQFGQEESFRLWRREYLLKNRNHYKALKRELEKVEALYQALGRPSPFHATTGSEP